MMNTFSRTIRSLVLLMLIAGLASCFKESFPKVGPPDDVAGDSITTAPVNSNSRQKVLIIGIDGCRGDAMEKADAPNIHGLLPHAVYSFDALTQAPTISGPGWSSMLTGVWSNKHGVKDNTFAGSNFTEYPIVFKYLKQINPKLRTVSICAWDPINQYLVTNADVKINTNENDEAVKDSAVAHLKNDNPDIMFLHFDEVDHAGHTFGFDTSIPQYMQAISNVDKYAGEILQAMNSRPNIANENWLVIISTDHGGLGKSHGGNTYQERNIFIIFYNKHFTSKEILPPKNTLKIEHFQQADQYASITDTTNDSFLDFDKYGQFTAQLSVRSSGLSSDNPFLTNKDWNSGGDPGWVIAVAGQSWKFNAGDGNNRVDVNANAPALSDGKWHNIAITVNEKGNVSLYQDDSLYNYSRVVGLNSWNNGGAPVKLATGSDITGNYRYDWGISDFYVANIRIWDTVLSESDLKQYAVACDTTYDSNNPFNKNLVGWWKATDGTGSIFKDYGPHKRDMQISGSLNWEQQQLNLCNTPLPPSVPTMVDIVPGILGWFHINADPGWKLDGISWLPR